MKKECIEPLHFITQGQEMEMHLRQVEQVLQAGVRWVQLRIKSRSDHEILPLARQIQALCQEFGAVFILNDRVELAKALDADGVHLGKKDMPPSRARALLGPDKIIGGTANTLNDLLGLEKQGVDYIGLGPFRFTKTKQNLSPVLGLAGYREIIQQLREVAIKIPVIGIGGIVLTDINALLQVPLDGVAVSGVIALAAHPEEVCKQFCQQIYKYKKK